MTQLWRAMIAAAVVTIAVGAGRAQSRTIQIYAAVVNQAGAPVMDLQPADFEVREGGVVRSVTSATLADEPMRIALLVDTSEEASPWINHFRAGLTSFLAAMPPQHEITLLSIGRQMRVRVPPTTDHAVLQKGIDNLFGDGGATVVLDAIREAHSRFLRRAENRWPVLVVLTTDGPDNSGGRDDEYERFIRELQATGATGHMMLFRTRGDGAAGQVGLNLRDYTGGIFEQVAVGSALGEQMKTFGKRVADHAGQIATEYKLSINLEGKDPNAALEVHVARDGVQVGLSAWRGVR